MLYVGRAPQLLHRDIPLMADNEQRAVSASKPVLLWAEDRTVALSGVWLWRALRIVPSGRES